MAGYWADDSTRLTPVVVLAIFSFFAVLAICLRLWARFIQGLKIELNDYLAIGGLVWILGETAFTIHSFVSWELGSDAISSTNPNAAMKFVVLQLKGMLVGQLLWACGVFLIRASVISLYVRIFRTRSFRITCHAVQAINAAYFVSIVLGALLICRPLNALWNHTKSTGKCGDQKPFALYLGIFNLLLDITVVVLPLPVLWGLQLNTRKKLVLSGIFGMGIVICIITLIRIKITNTLRRENAQKVNSLIALLTCLEGLLGVINACLPVMKPVFVKATKSRMWSSFASNVSPTRGSRFARSTGDQSRRRSGYHRSGGSASGQEMPVWPTSASTLDSLGPKYPNKQASEMTFPTPSKAPSDMPRPPPKGPNYQPRRPPWMDDEKKARILVQQDWDVERGDRI